MYEDGLCSGCGHPASRAHNPDMEGYYAPVTVTCQACAARDRESADQHGKGVLVGVVDESYAEGYEPRSAVATNEPRAPHYEADQGDYGAQQE
jgi:hypothetical protein